MELRINHVRINHSQPVYIFVLDSTESEASVMDQAAYELDGCSAEVKSVITQVLEEKETGASQ